MFGCFEKILIRFNILLRFSGCLGTKCPFMNNLDKCSRSCNVFISNKICVKQNKTKDVNLSVFNLITVTNELKTLIKWIPCKCKCIFDSKKCNSNQIWNNNKCQFDCKKLRKNVYGKGF